MLLRGYWTILEAYKRLGQNWDKCLAGLEELKPIKLTLIEPMSNKIMNTSPSRIGKKCCSYDSYAQNCVL